MFCLILFSLKKFIQNYVDYFFYWLISKKINQISEPESLSSYIKLFQGDLIKVYNVYIYHQLKMFESNLFKINRFRIAF